MQLDELGNAPIFGRLDDFLAPGSLVREAGHCHSMAKGCGRSLANEHARVENDLQRAFKVGRDVESDGHWLHLGWVEELGSSVDGIQGVKVLLGWTLDGREGFRLGAHGARPLALGLLPARAERELLALIAKVAHDIDDGICRVDVAGVEGPLSGSLAGWAAGAGDGIIAIARFDGQGGL
jgi:hypothetical protein